MIRKALAVCACGLMVAGCSVFGNKADSEESDESDESESPKKKKKTKKKAAAKGDVSATDIAAMRAKLDCSDRAEGYFCKALDRFASGKAPALGSGTFFFPGLALNVKTTKTKLTVAEGSYFIAQPKAAAFDSIIPETEQEKRQRITYFGYFYEGKLPPSTDPLVKFCKTLSTSVVVPTKVVGKSLRFKRPLKTGQTNTIYVRESPEDLVAVEIAPEPLRLKFFFVGVFPKALKTAQKQ
jgi:hypothetical protein